MYEAPRQPCAYCGHPGWDVARKWPVHELQVDGFRPCREDGCDCVDYCWTKREADEWRHIKAEVAR